MSRLSSAASPGPESWPSTDHTLFLRVHSADKLQLATTQSTYCKVYIGEAPIVNATHTRLSSFFKKSNANEPKHRSFHTSVSVSENKTVAKWNDKYEVPVEDIANDILSFRVKSKTPVYPLSIGSCAIQLSQLQLGTTVDQVFPLLKGDKTVGTIRLQLVLRENGAIVEPARRKRVKTKRAKETEQFRDDEYTLELEKAEFARRQREQEQELARDRQRLEEKMEQLRREEEQQARRRQQEEQERRQKEEQERRQREEQERSRSEARRASAAEAKTRARRQSKAERPRRSSQKEEDEMVKRLSATINRRHQTSNQRVNDSFEAHWRTPSDVNVHNMEHNGRSTLSLTAIADTVVQDALPSGSDDSDDDSDDSDHQYRLDKEDEQEFIRGIAKLKLKLIQKRKERQARAPRPSPVRKPNQPRRQRGYTSSTSSCSSGASPSCHTSEDESEDEEDEFDDEDEQKEEEEDDWKPMRSPAQSREKKRTTKTRKSNQANGGVIQSLTHGEISQKTGQDQGSPLKIGQLVGGAVNVAIAVAGDGDVDVDIGMDDAVGAIMSLAPIGRFVGQKLHEASAMVAQYNSPSTKAPEYNVVPNTVVQLNAASTQPTYYF